MSPIDSTIPYYPVNDFGPLMKGLVIGGVGIVHVFLAQFAIGGGMLLWYFERLYPIIFSVAALGRACRTLLPSKDDPSPPVATGGL